MEYYNILDFKKEPFSNSPEPEFLFLSPQHTGCLQKLELAIRLRRGLNVVIGDVGTGKTTLCRKLIQGFSQTRNDAETIETHLLLDPSFNTPLNFLQNVAAILGIRGIDGSENEWQLKEKIKDYLFDKGVKEEKIVVLVIDEGQKIAEDCLEILREFLNYETNEFKLLQIVMFAQKELKSLLKKRANLTDRINLLYYLKPFNFSQTRAMIKHRIDVARNYESGPALLSFGGLLAVYLYSGGYPRKVVSLCHQVILKLIIRGKRKAGFVFVRRCLSELARSGYNKIRWAPVALSLLMISCFLAAAAFYYYNPGIFNKRIYVQPVVLENINVNPSSPVEPSSAPAPEALPTENLSVPGGAQIISPGNVALAESSLEQSTKPEMPPTIGKLKLRKGRTLWWLLHNVYGEYSPAVTNAFIKANTDVKNIHQIMDGVLLNLPSLPAGDESLPKDSIFVQVRAGKDIQNEYDLFRDNFNQPDMPPVVFFPYWSRQEGMTFAVVLNKCFRNIDDARNDIQRLPPSIANQAKIIAGWGEGVVFFNRHRFNCSGGDSSGG